MARHAPTAVDYGHLLVSLGEVFVITTLLLLHVVLHGAAAAMYGAWKSRLVGADVPIPNVWQTPLVGSLLGNKGGRDENI